MERALNMNQVAERLGMSKRTLQRHLPTLRAKGLEVFKAKNINKIRESSLDAIIKRAAERDEDILSLN